MRASVIVSLILLALVGVGLRRGVVVSPAPRAMADAPKAPVPPAPPNRPKAPPEPARVAPVVKSGKAESAEPLWRAEVESQPHAQLGEAWNDALDEARSKVRVYLQSRRPPIQWEPSPEFVRKHLVKRSTTTPVTLEIASGPELQKLTLEVAITPEDLREVQKEDHKYRVEQRLGVAGRGLGGLVLLLGALAGFMRLDELTKGYFTFPLRLAALTLGVVGAGVVWFMI